MVFVKRQLDRDPQTLGEKLRALRRGQAVSLKMIEKQTRIQHRYLEALEQGRYEDLPEPLYTRKFIVAYARALHADETYFIELYQEECGKCDLVEPMRTPRQRVKRAKLFVWTYILQFVIAGLVVSLVVGYLGWQIKSIIEPPEVVVFSPIDTSISTEPIQRVEGIVDKNATVFVNGDQIVVDEKFYFATDVELERGLNEIVIQAEQRYSKRREIVRMVVFDPQEGS